MSNKDKKGEIHPLRVELYELASFAKETPFKPLIIGLEFIRNKKKWGGIFKAQPFILFLNET